MKSAAYYYRKASGLRECGHWGAADKVAKLAAKARRIERQKAKVRAARATMYALVGKAVQP
jgi:hypothetical protein